jgi:hypothetical protein
MAQESEKSFALGALGDKRRDGGGERSSRAY